MVKYILLDYKANFKERFKYACQQQEVYMYWIIMVTALTTKVATVGYSIFLLLSFFASLLGAMYPGYLSKAMYICPMSKDERRSYVLKNYLLKLGICGSLAVAVFSILEIAGLLIWQEAVLSGVLFMAHIAVLYVQISYEKKVMQHCVFKDENMGFYNEVRKSIFITIIIVEMLFCMIVKTGFNNKWETIFVGILMVASLVAVGCMLKSYLPKMIEWNSEYENCDRRYFDKNAPKAERKHSL